MANDQHTQHYGPDVLQRLTEDEPDWCLRWADAQREIERLRAACTREFSSVQTLDHECLRLRAALAELRDESRQVSGSEISAWWVAATCDAALAGSAEPADEPLPGSRPLADVVAEVEARPGMRERLDVARDRIREKIAEPANDAPVGVERFQEAPCYLCGYNGLGYYNSQIHPCAANYHEATMARRRCEPCGEWRTRPCSLGEKCAAFQQSAGQVKP